MKKFKTVEAIWTKIFDKLKVNMFSLSFLKANNITSTLCDFIPNGIPFNFLSEFRPLTFQQRTFQNIKPEVLSI